MNRWTHSSAWSGSQDDNFYDNFPCSGFRHLLTKLTPHFAPRFAPQTVRVILSPLSALPSVVRLNSSFALKPQLALLIIHPPFLIIPSFGQESSLPSSHPGFLSQQHPDSAQFRLSSSCPQTLVPQRPLPSQSRLSNQLLGARAFQLSRTPPRLLRLPQSKRQPPFMYPSRYLC